MNRKLKAALGASALVFATQALAQITFYEGEGQRGRAFTADQQVPDFVQVGFNDLASSAVVERGRWEICEDSYFNGRCVILQPGSYDSLRGFGMDKRISSVRRVADRDRYANEAPPPYPTPVYDYRRRPEERTYDVPVTSVHAVMGPPGQRCWTEREHVNESSRPNVGGAVVGAILGGVLGHQIGGGRGRDVATVGGAVAGGAIGANAGRQSGGTYEQDVQRCETTASGPPQYWDVTYDYRGVEHRVQLSAPPGPTIPVNEYGEPRQ